MNTFQCANSTKTVTKTVPFLKKILEVISLSFGATDALVLDDIWPGFQSQD